MHYYLFKKNFNYNLYETILVIIIWYTLCTCAAITPRVRFLNKNFGFGRTFIVLTWAIVFLNIFPAPHNAIRCVFMFGVLDDKRFPSILWCIVRHTLRTGTRFDFKQRDCSERPESGNTVNFGLSSFPSGVTNIQTQTRAHTNSHAAHTNTRKHVHKYEHRHRHRHTQTHPKDEHKYSYTYMRTHKRSQKYTQLAHTQTQTPRTV